MSDEMDISAEDTDEAIKMVLSVLDKYEHPTGEQIAKAVTAVLAVQDTLGNNVDSDVVRRQVESIVTVTQEETGGLVDDDPTSHVRWLDELRADPSKEWPFWDRYAEYMKKHQKLPLQVVQVLDDTTAKVLGELESPNREGEWQRRGLVIGDVQSGKTGQFIGLAAKAADAGYKLIVILAGVLDDLRAQTQTRVDKGLLGYDTSRQQQVRGRHKIGVGKMRGFKHPDINSLTTQKLKGDFNKNFAQQLGFKIGGTPVVLVIKKHQSIINHVTEWMRSMHGEEVGGGKSKVRDVPLLLIDDEADNASINTNKAGDGPTSINKSIRNLLNAFEKASYVGYTATPYANIFIDPDIDDPEHGKDLFPESFALTLHSPSNYFGPERLFGLVGDDGEDEKEPLPLTREINDATSWVPDGHKASLVIGKTMPESLKKAIDAFVLSCAARRARGNKDDIKSMLVHVTRFKKVQEQVAEQVLGYLLETQQDLATRFGTNAQRRLDRLQELWEKDFETTTKHFPAEDAKRLKWKQVKGHLPETVDKIEVRKVNGDAKDALEYEQHKGTGWSVIAVGGQKLSRGLTLEGLTVSYYLRLSSTYDTLLQMGRWFGYRPGYEDLCRLYTTRTLVSRYRWITQATAELRRDIDEMGVLGESPKSYGMKVMDGPLGLAITAPNKRRDGTSVRLSFSGELAETTVFDLSDKVPERNRKVLTEFAHHLDSLYRRDRSVKTTDEGMVWRNVSAEDVAAMFFDRYETSPEAHRVKPDLIAKYIRQCAGKDELGNWTVRVVNKQVRGENRIDSYQYKIKVGEDELWVTHRIELERSTLDRKVIKRVLSPAHESFDMTEEQKEAGRRAGKKTSGVPTGKPLRKQRNPQQALLLIYPIDYPLEKSGSDFNESERTEQEPRDNPEANPYLVGFAVAFPTSAGAVGVNYTVNNRWFEEPSDDAEIDA
ncbi:Z1 domain-containing protein [Nocardiopsis flavescens]|uniref:Z1 domain-containing protein n=1 Tax=Nocardiopsis flavescens TaxID=758803 RepID=UPI00364FE061